MSQEKPSKPSVFDRVTRPSIRAAAERIAGHIRQTPVIESGRGTFGQKESFTLKLECLQHSGSFKARGVFNHLLGQAVPEVGVCAASGGNHGAAVAYASQQLGIAANIFVPENSPASKVDRIRGYGATAHLGGHRYAEAQRLCEAFAAQSGALAIHPYDDIDTLVGQGTTAYEWQQQSPDLDTLLVAVGGGGLIGGMAAWTQGAPKLVSCEPEDSNAMYAALAAGQPIDVTVGSIAADSLGASRVGTTLFPLVQKYVRSAVLVTDEAIAAAQHMLWQNLQIVAEHGGSTALAALLSGAYQPDPGERVGVLVCGSNTVRI